MRVFWIIVILFIASTLCASDELVKIKLDDSGNFIDDKGNVLLFHGFNSVMKAPPWYPVEMLNRTQLEMFQNWGLNAVRLGVMWSGVMPEKNTVNKTYMKQLEAIIDACADHGLYVLLDMHQDTLSSRFGGYDGFPLWLVDEVCQTPKHLAYPWPFPGRPSQWPLNYLTYACADCAQNFYQNVSGSWDYWAEFWVTVAKQFGGKTNVLGYELLNEPALPNFYKSFFNIIPGIAGRAYLLPIYDYVVERIRKVDKDTLLFYEPVTYGIFLPELGYNTGTGFDRVPNALKDPDAHRTSVLSYHYYCWPLQASNTSRNMTWPLRAFCDLALLPSVLLNSELAVKQTGGGRFLTEFGVCDPDGNPDSVNTVECNAVLDLTDTTFQSWTYWDGNFLDRDGNPIPSQVQSFIRAYPQKTLGTPKDLKFDPSTGKFTYSFLFQGQKSSSDTEAALIYVPISVHYPNGVDVNVEPRIIKSILVDTQLRLFVPAGLSDQRIYITVRLAPK